VLGLLEELDKSTNTTIGETWKLNSLVLVVVTEALLYGSCLYLARIPNQQVAVSFSPSLLSLRGDMSCQSAMLRSPTRSLDRDRWENSSLSDRVQTQKLWTVFFKVQKFMEGHPVGGGYGK
jgi:hypothetical protein